MTLRTLTFDPAQYKLMPVEPDNQMVEAAPDGRTTAREMYRAMTRAVPDTLPGAVEHSVEPVGHQDIVSAIRAVENEAARRGAMFPQDSDEHAEDRRSVRRVVELIEWYATKGGAVATQLPGWPKHPVSPAPVQLVERQELSDADIDRYLNAVLRAAGSALSHHTMQKSIDDMRAAMRAAVAKDRGQA